jgi:uncharacterized protein
VELNHDFVVSVPIDHAWKVLTDLERIAPCMPGAQLTEVEGDEYRGVIKLKVGPISAQYKGTARVVELDEKTHRAVLRAEGRDTRGQGAASATIVAKLDEEGSGTSVHIETELDISGKVAQFGRGMLGEVSEKLLNQFVTDLEANVLSDDESAAPAEDPAPASQGAGAPATGSGVRVIDSPEAQPVDLIDAAGGSVVKRVLPLIVLIVVVALVVRTRRRR